MAKAVPGEWYVYTGEDGDAISVAMNGVGPQGGWTGISLARMSLPSKNASQEFLNAAAKKMSAAPELLAALKAVIAVADRKTVEFDAARAAIAKAEGK